MSIICLWTHPKPKDRLNWSFRFAWAVPPVRFGLIFYRFSQEFVKMCFSLQWEAQFCPAGHSILPQKTHFLAPQAARKWGTLVTLGSPGMQKLVGKMNIIWLWGHLSPSKPTPVCNLLAIWSLRGHFWWFFQMLHTFLKIFRRIFNDFLKICS